MPHGRDSRRTGDEVLQVLVHDQHAEPLLLTDSGQSSADVIRYHRREANRQLIAHQHPRTRHHRLADRARLLLAAAQCRGELAAALAELGK
jgi:hypothetical protein